MAHTSYRWALALFPSPPWAALPAKGGCFCCAPSTSGLTACFSDHEHIRHLLLRPKAKGMAVLLQGLLPRLQVGGEVNLLLVRKNDPSILEPCVPPGARRSSAVPGPGSVPSPGSLQPSRSPLKFETSA